MITLTNVTLAYSKDYDALANVNLEIANGQKIALVGESGSGKTALLRLIAGLDPLKNGSVLINDTPLKKVNFLTDVSLGYITTNPTFFERKTVYYNFVWILKNRKVPRRDREAKVRAVLDEFEISYLADIKVNKLNPLERRLVQIARLALRPLDILLCDNIFDGIEDDMLKQVKKVLLILINKEPAQKTVIIAGEAEELIKDLVDKVYYITGGSIMEPENEE